MSNLLVLSKRTVQNPKDVYFTTLNCCNWEKSHTCTFDRLENNPTLNKRQHVYGRTYMCLQEQSKQHSKPMCHFLTMSQLVRNNTNERQRKQPQDQLFWSLTHTLSNTHTLIPLLSGQTVHWESFTSRPETPTDADGALVCPDVA